MKVVYKLGLVIALPVGSMGFATVVALTAIANFP